MKTFKFFMGLVAVIMLAAGCAPTRLEMDYGTSYKLSKYNQILNPEAEKNLKPVTGMDGQAAQAVLDKYRKDFEKPAPATTYNFSIGTMK
jgi:hypothetical protein